MLKIQNIHKSFGEQKVLDGVSFELERGKVYTLVGGNNYFSVKLYIVTLFNISYFTGEKSIISTLLFTLCTDSSHSSCISQAFST